MNASGILLEKLTLRSSLILLSHNLQNSLRIRWEGGAYRVNRNISIHYKNNQIAFFGKSEDLQNGITIQLDENDKVFIQLENNKFIVFFNDQSVESLNRQFNLWGIAVFAGMYSFSMATGFMFLSIFKRLGFFSEGNIPPSNPYMIIGLGWFLFFAVFFLLQKYQKKNYKLGKLFIYLTIFIGFAYNVWVDGLEELNFFSHNIILSSLFLLIIFFSFLFALRKIPDGKIRDFVQF